MMIRRRYLSRSHTVKRLISLLLCLALCASLPVLAEGAASASPLPDPSGDLAFLSGYVDAVRAGDWFLACERETEPGPSDEIVRSATRNTTAPWVLLNARGEVLAENLRWWPEDDDWPLHPRPFEGFEDGVDTSVIRVGLKYGLIDRSGKITAEPVYDTIFGFTPGDKSTPAEKDGKWGCIDEAGNEVVPFIYDTSFSHFENGLTVAQRGGNDALLAEDGTELLPPEFSEMVIESGDDYGSAHRGSSCAVFDRQGKILFERKMTANSWIYTYNDSVPPFAYFDGALEREGYVNLDGTDAIPPIYDDAMSFWKGSDLAVVTLDGKQGMIRRDGSIAIPLEYDQLIGFSEGLCAAEKDGLWGYLDEDGGVAIPFQFADAHTFENGYACATPVGGWDEEESEFPSVCGLIDPTGAWVIAPMDCDTIAVGADGVAVACRNYDPVAWYRMTEDGVEEIVGLDRHDLFEDGMLPHEDASALAKLDGEKTLKKRVSEADRLPRLDGAARLFPLYASYVEAVYPKDVKFEAWDYESDLTLTASGEDEPWQRLSDGGADIIFMPAPDPEASIWATFAARGQEPVFIPLCRDAVVFLTDAGNPVESVTAEQLRQIYAGTTTDWADLGAAELGKIVAYQDYESEVKAAFDRTCGFTGLADAPEGVTGFDSWAGDVLTGPAAYRNLPNAAGYALRAECRALPDAGRVKYLAVGGVAPTDENIKRGSYPFFETLYAVVLKDNKNPNVAALLEWIQSEQGAELAEKTGFVAIE